MGTDILVELLYGFKIVLSHAFELGLVHPQIMESDAWQLIGDKEYEWRQDGEIFRHVLSPELRALLESGGEWNIHILASTQTDCNPSESFLFIYCERAKLYCGSIPDYKTGVIEKFGARAPFTIPGIPGVTAVHWIVACSW